MNRIKTPDVVCLHCKRKGTCITDSDYIETVDNIIVRPILCTACKKHWKDFYGDKDANSPVLSIQRNISSNNSRSVKGNGNDFLSEHNKISQNDGHKSS